MSTPERDAPSAPPHAAARDGEEANKMNVWNKVLLILTGLLCAVYAVLAANVYNNNKEWNLKNEGLEKQIAEQIDANVKLYNEIYGGAADVDVQSWKDCGLDGQLKHVRSLAFGDVFVNCEAAETKIDAAAMKATVMFGVDPQYNMSSFRTGAIVYLFDSGAAFKKADAADADAEPVAAVEEAPADETAVAASAPCVFLGEFKIVGAAASQVNLESVGTFTQAELDLVNAARLAGRSFTACVDRLPVDSPADIADFVAEQPNLIAAYDPAVVADMTKKTADAAQIAQCLGADDAASAQAFEDLFANNADVRVPVDYQARIERQWITRDAQNVTISRNAVALAEMDNVIADQLVLIGDKPSVGLESGYEALLAATANFEGFDDVYSAAKARKRVDSYFEKIDSTRASLAKMNDDCTLVETLLAEANDNNVECQRLIDELIVENAKLASDIACVMFALSDKIESMSSTASIDNTTTYQL